ncbi:unnamed protein product [Rhizoctonia solani]|uniref:Uncharacterized protein n=1 Tax=Rhizoctonia solani TaxID=456999 RepID=A0A8H2XTZ5_9AGAM|nr:unnamed protein product [Rhizoctonia solani]
MLDQEIQKFGQISAALDESQSRAIEAQERVRQVDNYHTGLGEALHPQSKATFSKKTNKQPGFEKQMLRTYLEQQAMIDIRAQIDRSNQNQNGRESSKACDVPRETVEPRIQLGSPMKRLLTSTFISERKQLYRDYKTFELDLRTFLYQNVPGLEVRRDFRQRDLPQLDGTMVVPHKLLRVPFISLENSQDALDLARINPSWRGTGSRNDYVVIRGDESEPIWFAQLLDVFALSFQGQDLQIAHIKRFRTRPQRSKQTGYIELDDYNVHNFIYVDSIIRTCVILSPGITPHRRVVADLVDADMYFRLLDFK